jgi:hypothetical protein
MRSVKIGGSVTHFVKESGPTHKGVAVLGEKRKESPWEWVLSFIVAFSGLLLVAFDFVWTFIVLGAIVLAILSLDLYKSMSKTIN